VFAHTAISQLSSGNADDRKLKTTNEHGHPIEDGSVFCGSLFQPARAMVTDRGSITKLVHHQRDETTGRGSIDRNMGVLKTL
jgi:hypothetical protein